MPNPVSWFEAIGTIAINLRPDAERSELTEMGAVMSRWIGPFSAPTDWSAFTITVVC